LAPILLRIEQEYGLTPSARAGLAVQPRKTEEEMESRYFG
jgi:phage terminase small subunit